MYMPLAAVTAAALQIKLIQERRRDSMLYPIIISIICLTYFGNPQHMRELLAPILLTFFVCYKFFRDGHKLRVPSSPLFYLVALYGVVITASYIFLTNQSSMNYRPLMLQYIGLLAFASTYLFDIDRDKLSKALFCSGVVLAVISIGIYMKSGYQYFSLLFMHKNVAGLFFAMVLLNSFKLSKIHLSLYLAGAALLLIALLLSGSAGAVLSFLICTLVLLGKHSGKPYIPMALLLFGAAIFFATPTGDTVSYRLKHGNITNGRWTIQWPKMWEKVKEAPIVGVGIGDMHVNDKPNNAGPHSLYLALHSYGGVFCLAIFLVVTIAAAVSAGPVSMSMAICTFMIYAIFSECATNNPLNLVIFWSFVGLGLKRYECKN